MALTVAAVDTTVFGRMKVAIATVTFDSSLAAGGEAFVPADVGMTAFLFVGIEDSNTGTVAKYDRVNGKITAYESGTADAGLNEADGDDLSASPIRVLCIGL